MSWEDVRCPFPQQPTAHQNCPPFHNPEEDPQEARQALEHAVLACWLSNYFCTLSKCPPWLGCYFSAPQKPFWTGWCCWHFIHWFLNQGLCSFTVVSRTRAFHGFWVSEPGAIEVTKSLSRKEQEEGSPELRIMVVCEDRSPLSKYQQASVWLYSNYSSKTALDL